VKESGSGFMDKEMHMGKKVILDTDISIGHLFRDVDDGLALLHLLAHPHEVELLGVTTTFGNASIKKTYPKAKELLHTVGRDDVPVFKGASASWKRKEKTEASDFLMETVCSLPGEVILLTIGPVTNVVTAIVNDPSFTENLKELIILGGEMLEEGKLVSPIPLELNFFFDAPSARILLRSAGNKTLIDTGLCHKVVFTRKELSILENQNSRLSRYLVPKVRHWLEVNRHVPFLPWKDGFIPWDVLATAMVIDPQLFSKTETLYLDVRPRGWARGRVFTDISRQVPPTRVPADVDAEMVLKSLLDSLGSFD
jgi:purine nucleosidase